MDSTIDVDVLKQELSQKSSEELTDLYLQKEEELKKVRQNQEKWVKKILNKNEIAEAKVKVLKNPEYLEELKTNNPDLADKVLQDPDVATATETVDQKVKDSVEQLRIQDYLDNILSQISQENRDAFLKNYAYITNGRKLTLADAKQAAQLSLNSSNQKVNKQMEDIARMSAIGGGTGNKSAGHVDKKAEARAETQSYSDQLLKDAGYKK